MCGKRCFAKTCIIEKVKCSFLLWCCTFGKPVLIYRCTAKCHSSRPKTSQAEPVNMIIVFWNTVVIIQLWQQQGLCPAVDSHSLCKAKREQVNCSVLYRNTGWGPSNKAYFWFAVNFYFTIHCKSSKVSPNLASFLCRFCLWLANGQANRNYM